MIFSGENKNSSIGNLIIGFRLLYFLRRQLKSEFLKKLFDLGLNKNKPKKDLKFSIT